MKLRHALRGTAAGLLLAVCLTTPTLALTGVVDVGGSVLRVRKTASTGSAVLDQLPSGKQVEIVDTATNGWYGIQLDSVKGYVSASYIKLLEEAAPVVTAEVSAVSASAAQSESTYVKVTADALNVRTGPGTDYAVADELAQGKVVKVLGAQDGWYQIGSGYIDAAYTEAATYEEALEQLYIRVVQGPLNIRSGPGTGYSKVGSLAKGRCVKVVSVQSGWYQIEQGYVSAAYVEETDYTPAAASSKGQELANIALQYVGYSYVYGGASPRVGFDCSGLVQYACAQLGYSINRTASAQLQNGVTVSWDELAPGDLVFFKKPGSTTSKPVTHVGMYIGSGQFVHASDYGVGVIVSNLSDAYYTTGTSSYIKDTIGILPNILNTLYIVLLAMTLVLPLGVGAAIYLTEYAANRRVVELIEFATETLTGIPSIIFGLVGMLFFVQKMDLQAGVLAGSLTLVVMILPTIVRTTQESLKTVPQSYREGALALGAGKWRMVRTVVLPNAVDGIVTGCILAVGRIVGESAALLYTAGFGLVLNDFVTALHSSSATLTVALYVYANDRGRTDVAFSIASVLMLLTLVINLTAALTGRKLKKNGGTQ